MKPYRTKLILQRFFVQKGGNMLPDIYEYRWILEEY